MATEQPNKKRVAIVGGGLQGCATAYYLRALGDPATFDVTIVERTGVASAASGKGGGFLARNWGSRTTRKLHELSFDLHRELAASLGLSSYRANLPTLEVTGELGLREWPPRDKTAKPIKRAALHPDWLDASDTKAKLMDAPEATAQVAPRELCEALFEASGATLVRGAAAGLEFDAKDERRVAGVRLDDGRVVPCDECVVALGAWSVLLEDWLPGGFALPMEGVYSSSIVLDSRDAVAQKIADAPRALFCAEDSNSCHLEVYPRPDGTVYVCGIGGSDHVRGPRLREGGDLQDASKMRANPARVEAAVRSLSGLLAREDDDDDDDEAAPAMAFETQACMRPCAPDALPLIGRLSAWPNVCVATGHNCWGILWAPITGKLVAELILGRTPSVDLTAFAPERFMPRAPKRGRAVADAQRVGEQW